MVESGWDLGMGLGEVDEGFREQSREESGDLAYRAREG